MRRTAQAFSNTPLTLFSLRPVPDAQLRMATGLFSLHRNLAGVVGVALSATVLQVRADVHTLLYAQRQMMYPMGTQHAIETIRKVLVQDGQMGTSLNQMTQAVLRQKLGESVAIASYQDLFAMFVILALMCLLPVLLMRHRKNLSMVGTKQIAVRAACIRLRPASAPDTTCGFWDAE